jgi:hypothetical protein
MTDDDKQLLLWAAKAAGIEIVGPVENFIVQPNTQHLGGFIIRNSTGGDSAWNPRSDDGDALRLAVILGIEIHIFDKSSVNCGIWSADPSVLWPSPIPFNSDPMNAVRLAITRAAAEIGKAMGE